MANFLTFIPIVLDVEAGYQNLVGDTGNYRSDGVRVGTNRGISAKVYESWIKRLPSIADMKAITANIAQQIYKAWYWDKMKADQIIDQSVANLIVDHAVNAGVSRGGKLLQATLNKYFAKNLSMDGIVGNATIQATNSVSGQQLFDRIKLERELYYRSIGGEFLNGWLNRLTEFAYEKKKK